MSNELNQPYRPEEDSDLEIEINGLQSPGNNSIKSTETNQSKPPRDYNNNNTNTNHNETDQHNNQQKKETERYQRAASTPKYDELKRADATCTSEISSGTPASAVSSQATATSNYVNNVAPAALSHQFSHNINNNNNNNKNSQNQNHSHNIHHNYTRSSQSHVSNSDRFNTSYNTTSTTDTGSYRYSNRNYYDNYDRQSRSKSNKRNNRIRKPQTMRDTDIYQEIERLSRNEKEGTMYLQFSYATIVQLVGDLPDQENYREILRQALDETDKRKGKKTIDEQVSIRDQYQKTHGLVFKNVPKDVVRQHLYQAIQNLPNDKERFTEKDFPGKCHLRSFPFPKAVSKDGTRNVFPIFVNSIDRDFILEYARQKKSLMLAIVDDHGNSRPIRLIVEKVHDTSNGSGNNKKMDENSNNNYQSNNNNNNSSNIDNNSLGHGHGNNHGQSANTNRGNHNQNGYDMPNQQQFNGHNPAEGNGQQGQGDNKQQPYAIGPIYNNTYYLRPDSLRPDATPFIPNINGQRPNPHAGAYNGHSGNQYRPHIPTTSISNTSIQMPVTQRSASPIGPNLLDSQNIGTFDNSCQSRNASGRTTPNSVMSFTSNISNSSTPMRGIGGTNQQFGNNLSRLKNSSGPVLTQKGGIPGSSQSNNNNHNSLNTNTNNTNTNGLSHREQTGISVTQGALFDQLNLNLSSPIGSDLNFGQGLGAGIGANTSTSNALDLSRLSNNSSPIQAINTPISQMSGCGSPPSQQDIQQAFEKQIRNNDQLIRSLSQEHLNLVAGGTTSQQPVLNDPAIISQGSVNQFNTLSLSQPRTPPPISSTIGLSPTGGLINTGLLTQNLNPDSESSTSILTNVGTSNRLISDLLRAITPPLVQPSLVQSHALQNLEQQLRQSPVLSGLISQAQVQAPVPPISMPNQNNFVSLGSLTPPLQQSQVPVQIQVQQQQLQQQLQQHQVQQQVQQQQLQQQQIQQQLQQQLQQQQLHQQQQQQPTILVSQLAFPNQLTTNQSVVRQSPMSVSTSPLKQALPDTSPTVPPRLQNIQLQGVQNAQNMLRHANVASPHGAIGESPKSSTHPNTPANDKERPQLIVQ